MWAGDPGARSEAGVRKEYLISKEYFTFMCAGGAQAHEAFDDKTVRNI
jgi:hypothetical protein